MTQNNPKKLKSRISRRGFMRLAGLTSASAVMAACSQPTPEPQQPAAPEETESVEAAMPLKGTKIKVYLLEQNFNTFVQSIIPEFTAQTGIEVESEIGAFNIALQQMEVELSSGSSTYDVTPQIFIKAQRWMRAGWCAPLDDYIAKSKFDIEDYIQSTIDAMTWEGVHYGIPWLAESTQMIYRKDVLDAAGLKPPTTFDELDTVLAAIHNPPDLYAYVARTEPNGVHFPFPIWLQGFGGNVFRDPPNDMTPTLNTPEAITATERFTDIILKYSIAGSQIYNNSDCQNAVAQGKAALWVDALGIFGPIFQTDKSVVADKASIALVPGGPAGTFPQIATHGMLIPKAAKNKDAAWEFINWACSKEVMMRAAIESTHSAQPRKSILTDPEYGEKYNKGDAKVGELVAEALNLAKPAYRVVPEFPEVGARIGQGIGEIISGQKSVQEAMDSVQTDVEQIIITAGHEINP